MATKLSNAYGTLVPKLMVNPLIMINMGAEMIYILQQRLSAQNIEINKSSRVLLDTVSALFDLQMTDTMFQQQPVYESASVRELFHRITHSSIMRLNDHSMDKLYDLMLMGFKAQVVRSRDCNELIESTLNHIDTVYHIIDTNCKIKIENKAKAKSKTTDPENVLIMIANIRDKVVKTYLNQLSSSKLLVIRKYLLQWLQDRRIKVSILLQRNLQSRNGHINTDTNGILPKYTEIPGISVMRRYVSVLEIIIAIVINR